MVAKRMKFEPVEMVEEVGPTSVVEDVIKGDDIQTIETTNVTDVENPAFTEKAQLLSFYEEPLTITIHTTHDPNADQIFAIGVNGKQKVFKRGETYENVPRKFVEGLMRARPVHYANEEYRRDDGTQAVRNPGRSGIRYGFQVVKDENPIGGEWLMAISAQP